MTRDRKFHIAHVTGHVFWWVFVVALLFPEISGGTVSGATVYQGAYQPLRDSGHTLTMWTDYRPSDGFCPGTALAAVALAVVVIAAIIEAAVVHRQTQGWITVAVPLFAGLAIWNAVPGCGSPRTAGLFALPIVLLAVAAREIWARGYAPRPS
ncbi:hypothetical protein GPX89_22250 [Nocardia sp. ET3-3]|uniref:Uncharacterized protein n=1 Tax=Nocardia terrae TaxID=2675851 RepID=A0A7K1V024_9NOCA|nr:hypothetical protein [Nocardia terrae]MVU79954.1 hypothetical protein [Nocardia terrae]